MEAFIGLLAVLLFLCWAFTQTGCTTMPVLTTPEGDRLKGEGTLSRQTIDIPQGSTALLTFASDTQASTINATLIDAEAQHRANRIFLYAAGICLIAAVILAKIGHWIIAGLFAGAAGLLIWIWRNPAILDWWVPALLIAGAISLYTGYTYRQQEEAGIDKT